MEGELFIPSDVEDFLENIWRRFGHHSAEHLTRLVKKSPRAEITLTAMRLAFTRAEKTPDLNQVVRLKVMRPQSGRPVGVANWCPKRRSRARARKKPGRKDRRGSDLDAGQQAGAAQLTIRSGPFTPGAGFIRNTAPDRRRATRPPTSPCRPRRRCAPAPFAARPGGKPRRSPGGRRGGRRRVPPGRGV